jgi:hypothetical protein
VTLGRQLRRPELATVGARWCEVALPEGSVYRFLARERGRLFPAELFADLFQPTGRRSVPPSILAVVMVLQRLEGLSDREAADRFAFDVRWRYAAGVADAVAGEETASFAHTVLVDFRARLRASADPDRIFRVTTELARQLGLVGVKRVLDSAPLEDAVTTQDTVTMLRGAIRGLLRACPPALKAKVRAGLQREDDYAAPGKPACDWTDRAAREALVDALVRDAYRAHFALRGERLDPRTAEAAVLLATVTGQDIEETTDGRFRIFEGTAPDRVISTVDPQARHGHKKTFRNRLLRRRPRTWLGRLVEGDVEPSPGRGAGASQLRRGGQLPPHTIGVVQHQQSRPLLDDVAAESRSRPWRSRSSSTSATSKPTCDRRPPGTNPSPARSSATLRASRCSTLRSRLIPAAWASCHPAPSGKVRHPSATSASRKATCRPNRAV